MTMTMTRMLASLTSLLALAPPAAVFAQPEARKSCLTFKDVTPTNQLAAQLNVAYELQVTPEGRAALEQMKRAYVQIEFQSNTAKTPYVRLLEGPPDGDANRRNEPLATQFAFSRRGVYTMQLRRAETFGWPDTDGSGQPAPGCALQEIRVEPGPRIGDFSGTSAQWWLAYRPATRAEAGGSIFFKRFGLAASVEANVPRFIGDRDDPSNLNPVTVAAEVRWRGSRGYLGGSVRYFPDKEQDLDHYRFGVVAGEELPSFKGLPIWLVVDLRLNDPKVDFWQELSFSLAFRFDMPGSRP